MSIAKLLRSRLLRIGAVLGSVSLVAAACGSGASGGGSQGSATAKQTLKVAIVSNPQMTDLQKLTSYFEKLHPNITIKYDTLPENQLRTQIQKDVATNSGLFDVAMISNYETPIWAKNKWLTNLSSNFLSKDASYQVGDLLPPIAKSLSYNGSLYSVPFYGESSFLMYRKSLLSQAGITMPSHPTWTQIASYAAKLDKPGQTAGICLRGETGWGENLAPLDTVVNTFGGRWFNSKWQPQLTSPAFENAVSFYVNLVRKYGEPGAATQGFTGNLTDYTQGKCAMWYDATSAGGDIKAASPSVYADTGFTFAPVDKTSYSGWLYSWSFGIPSDSTHKSAAWTFISWATSKGYINLVGQKLGWAEVPPGTRTSTYHLPQYQSAAGSFANPTISSIDHTNPAHPAVQSTPYTGIQFVDIPQFENLGDEVSQQISAAIAGTETVTAALQTAQQDAIPVGQAQSSS